MSSSLLSRTSHPLLMTAKQVSMATGLSLRTIWRYRTQRLLPRPVEIGSSIRWRARDIDLWISFGCPDAATFEARENLEVKK